MPFAVSERDGVLTLTLDTPKSPINIFNHETAHQLIDILAGVSPATTRAIVFETAKPNSFINGVGLLLAHASQNYDDVLRASTPPWTAYRAVCEAPVPTIAVIQGNCFGCGVEFALNCDYRIATDDGETQFYMTELNDYLFTPLFGSTWNLPEAVGLEAAIDLLLWGERWQAPRAHAGGLVDEVVPAAQRHERTQQFLEQVLQGKQPSRGRGRVSWGADEDAVMGRARQRIQSLPPEYHKVYTDALELLEAGARQVGTYVEHQQRELRCSADSALSANGKAAYAFFYLRQMASERAAGRRRGDEAPLTLSWQANGDSGVQDLAAALRNRKLAGVEFADDTAADFRFVAAAEATKSAASASVRDIAVHASFAAGPVRGSAAAEMYAPDYRNGGRLLELATRPEGKPDLTKEDVARLTRTLQRFGFEVALTAPRETFVANRFLFAYLAPLLAYVDRGGVAKVANASLREAGFVRRPHELVAGFGVQGSGSEMRGSGFGVRGSGFGQLNSGTPNPEPLTPNPLIISLAACIQRPTAEITPQLAALANPDYSAAPDSVIMDALCISLLDAVLTARERGEVRDLPTADLIARELLDFPRHLCSLCSWLKRERVARAVQRDSRVESLVAESALVRASSFAANGREFYR